MLDKFNKQKGEAVATEKVQSVLDLKRQVANSIKKMSDKELQETLDNHLYELDIQQKYINDLNTEKQKRQVEKNNKEA